MSRLPFALIGLTTLGACAISAHPPVQVANAASHADGHVIDVTQTSARMEIGVNENAAALTDKAQSDLREFASAYLRYGHGALILSTPSGSGNAELASVLAGKTRMALVESGVAFGAVAGSTYDASGQPDAPLVVTFARFEAQAPECAPIWSQDLAHQSDNQPWESFGCSMQANLAAMVEDPSDLLQPREADARIGGRRETVMQAYRQGQITHAQRDSDEHAIVSNVAQ